MTTAPDELTALRQRIEQLEGRTPKVQGSQVIGAGRLGTLNEATPPTETDRMIASYLVGCEDELREARKQKDRSAATDVERAMTARLDALDADRRARVRALTEETRKVRESSLNPAPTAAPVRQAGLTEGWGRTKTTSRYADGTFEVVDAATGEVLVKRQRTARQFFGGVFGRSDKPVPTRTVTKGRSGVPRTS